MPVAWRRYGRLPVLDVALRIDANGAWDVEQAVRNIEALAPTGLELVEEPVHGLAGVREVRERVATARGNR